MRFRRVFLGVLCVMPNPAGDASAPTSPNLSITACALAPRPFSMDRPDPFFRRVVRSPIFRGFARARAVIHEQRQEILELEGLQDWERIQQVLSGNTSVHFDVEDITNAKRALIQRFNERKPLHTLPSTLYWIETPAGPHLLHIMVYLSDTEVWRMDFPDVPSDSPLYHQTILKAYDALDVEILITQAERSLQVQELNSFRWAKLKGQIPMAFEAAAIDAAAAVRLTGLTRPDASSFAGVAQGEFAITFRGAPLSVLKTTDANPCIICTIYDARRGIGLLAHIGVLKANEPRSYETMIQALLDAGSSLKNLDIRLWSSTTAPAIDNARKVREGLRAAFATVGVPLKSRIPLDMQPLTRHIGLDVKTGEVFNLIHVLRIGPEFAALDQRERDAQSKPALIPFVPDPAAARHYAPRHAAILRAIAQNSAPSSPLVIRKPLRTAA
jgi:hypothetical protein